jgi:hypothetical protein
MSPTPASLALVGPYGLHALGAATIGLLLIFIWVFNFTTFF